MQNQLMTFALLLAVYQLGSAVSGKETSPYLRSTWDTAYESPSGVVRALVKIDGSIGTYTFLTGGTQPTGRLSGIQFIRNFNHEALGRQLGPATNALVGRWQLFNATGYFVFREPDSRGTMDGYFGSFLRNGELSEVHGSWDGRLVELRPEPPNLKVTFGDDPSTTGPAPLGMSDSSPEVRLLSGLPTTSDEQVVGRTTDIIPVSFLRVGLEKSSAVGQLRLREDARPIGDDGVNPVIRRKLDPLGTCFRISSSLVMTAYHVYKSDPDELLNKLEINFETEGAEYVRPIIREELVLKELDVAILRSDSSSKDKAPRFRLNGAVDRQGNARIVANEGLQMLHFPADFPGLRLTVHNSFFKPKTFEEPTLEGVDVTDLLFYTTDTDDGSSGAPLMNSIEDCAANGPL